MRVQAEDKYPSLKDPGMRAYMMASDRLYPADAVNFTVAEQRVFYDSYCAHFRKPRPAGVAVSDFKVGEVPCRLYRPPDAEDPPLLLYLHGGGYVVGSLDSHDDVCAEICAGAGVSVVGVNYRLAPEHPFPAAFEDCWQVLAELAGRSGKIMVGGDSAGGCLAAALCLKARDAAAPVISGQVLIYPGLGGDMTRGSYLTQADAPALTTRDVCYYRDIYRGGGHKFAEPLRETNFTGLPPAFMVAAGLDPLHDDCGSYADKLRAAGVPAHVRHEPLLVHSFLRARHMSDPARESFAAIVNAVHHLGHHGHLPPTGT